VSDPIRDALLRALEPFGVFEEDIVLELEVPKDPRFGDVTTNVALILAKRLERKPRELAGEIAASFDLGKDVVASVEIAGPGFINFRLAPRVWSDRVLHILEAGTEFGRSAQGQGQKVNLEFISANPTGPFNIVSARAASVGSALTRCLGMAGYRPHAEFYCNDAGRQVLLLGYSLRARYAQATGREDLSIPEDGYQGEYLVTMAQELVDDPGSAAQLSLNDGVGRISGELSAPEGTPPEWMELEEAESAARFGRYALLRNIAQQRDTCARFGLVFDTWFLESDLHRQDKLQEALATLRGNGHVFKKEGAVWFRSTEFGDEKDRVLVKADGTPTYFLADIAYHAGKHARGFERAVDFFGPDHHGHITRMEGAMQALGLPEDWLEILVLQQVNLILDGQPLEMSKRAGRLVTMDQLLDEVGADVAKFFFLDRKNNSHMDFDLDLAKQQSNDNPVYYVKYAHARICSVLRNAEEREEDFPEATAEELDLLTSKPEVDLMRRLHELPAVVGCLGVRGAAGLDHAVA